MSDPIIDNNLKTAYIEFRKNPANIKLTDQWFCNKHGISLAHLDEIKSANPDIESTLSGIEVTDAEIGVKAGVMVRQALDNVITKGATIKSVEGFLNALVAYMKQRQLESGKPTEILKIDINELKKKTPHELNQHLLGLIRHGSRN